MSTQLPNITFHNHAAIRSPSGDTEEELLWLFHERQRMEEACQDELAWLEAEMPSASGRDERIVSPSPSLPTWDGGAPLPPLPAVVQSAAGANRNRPRKKRRGHAVADQQRGLVQEIREAQLARQRYRDAVASATEAGHAAQQHEADRLDKVLTRLDGVEGRPNRDGAEGRLNPRHPPRATSTYPSTTAGDSSRIEPYSPSRRAPTPGAIPSFYLDAPVSNADGSCAPPCEARSLRRSHSTMDLPQKPSWWRKTRVPGASCGAFGQQMLNKLRQKHSLPC